MTKKQNKPAKWATVADPAKKRLNFGISQTIAYMRIISETMSRLKVNKEMTPQLDLHLSSVFRAADMILKQFFKVSQNTIIETGNRVNPDFIDEKSRELVRSLTKRIVMPGEKEFNFQTLVHGKDGKK